MPIEIWFQDESRVGQKYEITRRWAGRRTRPSAQKDQLAKSADIFSTIRREQVKGVGLVLLCYDIETMTLHLAEISRTVALDAHATVLVDQVNWHMIDKLDVPANITTITPPPKCPKLNPVEDIWQFMRGNWLSNCAFSSDGNIVGHCCQPGTSTTPWHIITIGRRKWIGRL